MSQSSSTLAHRTLILLELSSDACEHVGSKVSNEKQLVVSALCDRQNLVCFLGSGINLERYGSSSLPLQIWTSLERGNASNLVVSSRSFAESLTMIATSSLQDGSRNLSQWHATLMYLIMQSVQRWKLEIAKFGSPRLLVYQEKQYMEIGSKTMEVFNINNDSRRRQKGIQPNKPL